MASFVLEGGAPLVLALATRRLSRDEGVSKKLLHGGPPPPVLLQAPPHEAAELRRRRDGHLRRGGEAHGQDERRPVRPLPGGHEREPAGVAFEQHDSQGPHVAGEVGAATAAEPFRVELLGAHVRPRAGWLVVGFVAARDDAAGAEVGDLDLAAVADEEVGRLHVAVRDAEAVQVAQATEHAPRDAGDGGLREGAPHEHVAQGALREVLEDEVHEPVPGDGWLTQTPWRRTTDGGRRRGATRRCAPASRSAAPSSRISWLRARRRAPVPRPVDRAAAPRPTTDSISSSARTGEPGGVDGRAAKGWSRCGNGGGDAGTDSRSCRRSRSFAIAIAESNADSLYWTSNGG